MTCYFISAHIFIGSLDDGLGYSKKMSIQRDNAMPNSHKQTADQEMKEMKECLLRIEKQIEIGLNNRISGIEQTHH